MSQAAGNAGRRSLNLRVFLVFVSFVTFVAFVVDAFFSAGFAGSRLRSTVSFSSSGEARRSASGAKAAAFNVVFFVIFVGLRDLRGSVQAVG